MREYKIQECDGCGRVRDTEGGFCGDCIRAELCCSSEQEAARRNCGCKGGAARTLTMLRDRPGR